jgi:hypothetical protein
MFTTTSPAGVPASISPPDPGVAPTPLLTLGLVERPTSPQPTNINAVATIQSFFI